MQTASRDEMVESDMTGHERRIRACVLAASDSTSSMRKLRTIQYSFVAMATEAKSTSLLDAVDVTVLTQTDLL